jgi:hypothetical protein
MVVGAVDGLSALVDGVHYFAAWEAAGITQDVRDGLRDRVRLTEGRAAAPSAAVIDWSLGRQPRPWASPVVATMPGKRSRTQAAHRRRYARPAVVRAGHHIIGTRSRWRQAPTRTAHHLVSAHPSGVGRRRLCRQARRLGRRTYSPAAADREMIRRHKRIH